MKFDRQAKAALIVCLATLVVCGLGSQAAVKAWKVYLQKLPVELRESLSTIPRHLGEWDAVGDDEVLTKEIVEELGTDKYISRHYERSYGESKDKVRLDIHVAYYTGMIDGVPHVPDRCLAAAGWEPLSATPTELALRVDQSQWRLDADNVHPRAQKPYPVTMVQKPLTGRPMTVHLPVGDLKLRVTEFCLRARPSVHIFAGYLFVANGQVTPNPYHVQWLAFNKDDKYAYYCKVQFVMVVESNTTDSAVFVDRVSDLLGQMLPELMRCLPDWPEQQRLDGGSSSEAAPGPEKPAQDESKQVFAAPVESGFRSPVSFARCVASLAGRRGEVFSLR